MTAQTWGWSASRIGVRYAPRVTVPYIAPVSDECGEPSRPHRWTCSRPLGHTGRHNAAVLNGVVVAVWDNPLGRACEACDAEPAEPCRPSCLGYALEHDTIMEPPC